MTLKKTTLHLSMSTLKVSRFRFIFGILIGLVHAFAFYSFLYIFREAFRLLSITEAYEVWILKDTEVGFYNLVFAFIAVIMAQSACFIFWFDRPQKIFHKHSLKAKIIVNDQRVLNWSFLSFFSKISLIWIIIFGLTFQGGYYTFSLYPDCNYFFILVIIVLFFQTWNTIRLRFKSKGLTKMLISIAIVSGVSVVLSRIDVIDYKKINALVLQNNIFENYHLEVPKSDAYIIPDDHSSPFFKRIKNIYVVTTKSAPDSDKPLIIIDGEELTFEGVEEKLMEWIRLKIDLTEITIRLVIHANIKMEVVNKVKEKISKAFIPKIAYAVTPLNPEFDHRYYRNLSISASLPIVNELIDTRLDLSIANYSNIIKINQSEGEYCLFNDSLTEITHLKGLIKSKIYENPDYLIKLYVNDNLSFSDYIKILSSYREAVDELRKEFAMIRFHGKAYDDLGYHELREVKGKYPDNMIELNH